MSENERKNIAEMVETAKYLAENDPQGLLIARSNMDILKARADMERRYEQKEVVQVSNTEELMAALNEELDNCIRKLRDATYGYESRQVDKISWTI